MTWTEILTMRGQRAELVKEANGLLATAKTENRNLNAQEAEKFDKIHAQADEMYEKIQREERQFKANETVQTATQNNATEAARGHVEPEATGTNQKSEQELRNLANEAYLRYGWGGVSAEQAALSQRMATRFNDGDEQRALSVGTNSAGGYTVAPDTTFYNTIEQGLKYYLTDLSIFDVMDTATGASLALPTTNDTANTGALVSENSDVGSITDPTFAQVTLSAYLFSSKPLLVSLNLLQDSGVNVEERIGRLLGERLGRTLASYITTGTGSSQPKGLVAAAAAGVTAASATAITALELIDLQHSVDPAHRASPFCRYMFADSTLKAIRKLVDSQNRPLFQAGYAVGGPDTINGVPFVVNPAMSSIATGVKSVLFGDMKKFIIRRVKAFQIQRLVERYAEYGQVGFLGFTRWDSTLLDAGTNPIKYLVQA